MTGIPFKILMLDVAAHAAKTVRYLAEEAGWSVWEDAAQGCLRKIKSGEYDLVLIETSAPGQDSFKLCAAIRRISSFTRIVMITSEGELAERLQGFQAGADDCISKPFSPRELLHRMRAILCRTTSNRRQSPYPAVSSRVLSAKLEVDMHAPYVRVNRASVRLSLCEYKLLRYLAERSNQTVSREELVQRVWQSKEIGYMRTVDANIKRIRTKLKRISPELGGIIRTQRGEGYCLLDPSAFTGSG